MSNSNPSHTLNHKEISEEKARMLSRDPDANVRLAVAEYCDTPDDVLQTLASDQDPVVRRAVAENPNTPEAVHSVLISDVCADVSSAAIFAKTLKQGLLNEVDPENLQLMASHRHPAVRHAIAMNPNTPEWVLIFVLCKDPYRAVQRAAVIELKRRDKLETQENSGQE